MLTVYSPDSFLPERSYIINCLLGEFLGLDYELKTSGTEDYYRIAVPEGKELLFRDAFFSRFSEKEGYLKSSIIPDKIEELKESLLEYYNTPVLFGTNEILKKEDKIICNADLFASAFFMLSRWEEYVIKDRDVHNRFPGESALSVRFNFHCRPLVDEYTEIIWVLLRMAGFKGERKARKYSIVPTHDIDHLIFWERKNSNAILKNVTGDLFKRKNIKIAMRRVISFCRSFLNKSSDPCLRFEYFMDLAEKSGVKANFYFISGQNSSYDPEKYIGKSIFSNVLSEIKRRDHVIGIHPSYNSFNNLTLLKHELGELNKASDSDIKSGRQHYLRFEVPLTWQIWEECRLERDSSMYFSGYPGFRCGTCHEFPVFDIVSRKALDLREMPLILMDTCLNNLDPDIAAEKIKSLKNEVRKYNGNFVFLWHNCLNFNDNSFQLNKVFEKELYA